MFAKTNVPLFFGLTHIGQVFSLGWAKKFGSAFVYDSNEELNKKFIAGELTSEEPELNSFYKNIKKIFFSLKKKRKLKNLIMYFSLSIHHLIFMVKQKFLRLIKN